MENKTRYFQWIATEKRSQIQIFDKIEEDDGIIYICFKDGSRIDETLVLSINQKPETGKVMAEIEDPKNCWKFNERWVGREEEKYEINSDGERVCIQPFVEGRKVIDLIPPKPTTSKFGNLKSAAITQSENNIISDSANKIEQQSSNIDVNDPVVITLKKSKKKETEVTMVLNINLPSKDLYNLIKENFENGNEKALEYIIQEIDVKDIKESLKVSLKEMYETAIIENDPIYQH